MREPKDTGAGGGATENVPPSVDAPAGDRYAVERSETLSLRGRQPTIPYRQLSQNPLLAADSS